MNQDKQVLVSAIITTYKRPVTILKRSIQSVINQTHKNMEIIVVNDCPEEPLLSDVQKMIDEFALENLKYIVHEKNYGACKARNTGILASSGEFIALLDDDDEWLNEKIEKQLKGFSKDSIGMVYSPYYNITSRLPGKLTYEGKKSGDLSNDLLYKNCVGGSSMPIMRKSVFDTCGLFDETLLSSQDYDMWIRIAQKYEIICVNVPLINRFLLEESITKNYDKQIQGFNAFTTKHKHLYENNVKAYNYRLNRRANKHYQCGLYHEAKTLRKEARKAKIFSIYNITEPLKGYIKRLLLIVKL